MPQIAIGNKETRFWRRDGHEPLLFRLKQGVEMRMSRVHAGRADRFDLLVGQFGRNYLFLNAHFSEMMNRTMTGASFSP
jgi:hypothetical protein